MSAKVKAKLKRMGPALREARLVRKLSQSQLARKSKVNQVVISQIENGHTRKPLLSTFLLIIEALNLEPGDILTGDK